MHVIYMILNTINGKFYIGSAIDADERQYMHGYYLSRGIHRNKYLQAAYDKYGEKHLHFIIIETVSDKNDLIKIEQLWLDASQCYDREIGYNLSPTAGSTLGKETSLQTRIKIGNGNRGKKRSEEFKIEARKRKHSLETIEKLRTISINNQSRKHIPPLEGNQFRRDKNKWPHESGCKCKCTECKARRMTYYHPKNKIMSVEF